MSLIAVTDVLVHLHTLKSFSTESDGVHKLRVRLYGTNFDEDTLETRKFREAVDTENVWYIEPSKIAILERDHQGKFIGSDLNSFEWINTGNADGECIKGKPIAQKGIVTKRLPLFFELGSENSVGIDTFLLYKLHLPYPSWKGYMVLLIDLCVQVMPVVFAL
jgi:hypothetical protein